MHLRIASTDGAELESTFGDEPLEFSVGDGNVAEGLEAALLGLRAGEKRKVELEAGAAFGDRQGHLIQKLPIGEFPEAVEPGFVWAFETPQGDELAGTVLSVENGHVEVDFNHPLAGKPAVLDVEILAVEIRAEKVEP